MLKNVAALLTSVSGRMYIYGVLAAIAALLVSYGVVEMDALPLWMGIVVAALAVPSPALLAKRPSPPDATPESEVKE